MKSLSLLALLFLLSHAVTAAPKLVGSFEDPAGDDFGAGNLIYPQNADYQDGDLDLRALRIIRDDDGLWFEAAFANPIRSPSAAYMGAAADSVADFARKGFYTFNLDVYIDIDRKPDSGNTFSLPGRSVRIDSTYAWEKAVILTPRPELMRTELLDALQRQYPYRAMAEGEASVDQSVYFPTKIKVRGRTISFFVPMDFVGTADLQSMAFTVLVTGAKPYSSVGGLLQSRKTPLEEIELGVLQPISGHPRTTFGVSGGIASPVVDMLLPTVTQQRGLLANRQPLSGVFIGVNSAIPAAAVTATGTPVTASNAGFLGKLMGDGAAATRAADSGSQLNRYLDPEVLPSRVPSDESQPAERSIGKRLATLKQLLKDGLISEAEFQQQKQRILGEL